MCENSFCENIQIQFGKIIFPIEWQMWRLHFLKRQSLLCHLHQWRYKNITLWKPHESLMRWHHIHCYNGFCPSQFVGGGYLLIHTSWYITNNIGLAQHKLHCCATNSCINAHIFLDHKHINLSKFHVECLICHSVCS